MTAFNAALVYCIYRIESFYLFLHVFYQVYFLIFIVLFGLHIVNCCFLYVLCK